MVSVIIRAHGDGLFLTETIVSVLVQKDLAELIIVLDKPSQKLRQICDRFRSNSNVHFIELDRSNLSRAMNYGLSFATSEFVSVIDSDDVMLANKLSIQQEFLVENIHVPVIGSNFFKIDTFGKRLELVRLPEVTMPNGIKSQTPCPLAHSAVMFRRKVVLDYGGYREKFEWAEDIDLWIRINKDFELHNIQIPLIYYRIHNLQSTSSNFDKISKALVATKIENGLICTNRLSKILSCSSLTDFYHNEKMNPTLNYYRMLELVTLKLNNYKKRNRAIRYSLFRILKKIMSVNQET